MRLSTRLAVVATAAASLTAAGGTLANAAPAGPRLATTASAMTTTGIATDGKHVFIGTTAGLLRTNMDGTGQAQLTTTPVSDLTLTANRKTLFVAEKAALDLVGVATATGKVTSRRLLPAGQCPVSVAVTAAHLVYGYTCDGQFGGVGFLNRSHPAAAPKVYTGIYSPLVRAIPGRDAVVSITVGQSPAQVQVLDPTKIDNSGFLMNCSNVQDLAVAPDGKTFIPACGAPYEFDRYAVSSLLVTASYSGTPYPNAIAMAPSGKQIAGGCDGIYNQDVWISTTQPAPSLQASVEIGVAVPRGLTFTPDSKWIYALGYDSATALTTLYRIPANTT